VSLSPDSYPILFDRKLAKQLEPNCGLRSEYRVDLRRRLFADLSDQFLDDFAIDCRSGVGR